MSNHIGTLMPRVSAEIDKISNQVLLDKVGFGLAQFKILLILLSSDGLKQVDIAQKLIQTEPSISRQVNLLQTRKHVSVKANSSNKRERIIVLTSKGRQKAEEAVRILNEYHQPMFEILGEEKQNELRRILLTMHEYLLRKND